MCMSGPQYIQAPPLTPPATEAQKLFAAHLAAPGLSQRETNVTELTTFTAPGAKEVTPTPKTPRKSAIADYQSLTIGT